MIESNPYNRPPPGTIIDGIDRARVSCRKFSKEEKIRQTEEHHAFQIACKGNVVIKIEKCYIVSKNTVHELGS